MLKQTEMQQDDESTSSSASGSEGEIENFADETQSYEGVTAADFEEFAESITPMMQGISAATVVLVVAVFFCAGVMTVQTLLRSMERI